MSPIPGPAPKNSATRRGDSLQSNIVKLPANGRQGDCPVWPMSTPATNAEEQLWDQLWCTPQAHAWDALGWNRLVARYVQVLLTAEAPPYSAALLAECRQLEDRLGLSAMALLRLRWVIVDDIPPPIVAQLALVKPIRKYVPKG